MTDRHNTPGREKTRPGSPTTIGAIVLAAGFSRRFGAIKLNARLPHGGTVFESSLNNISQAFGDIIIVGRRELDDIGTYSAALHRTESCRLLFSDDADRGMGHSLACAAHAIPDHWLACFVFLADMPFIHPDTLRQLRQQAREESLIVPCWRGQRGHPTGFGRKYFDALRQCSGDSGARHLLRDPAAVTLVDVNDAGIVQDIDTPADLPH